MQHCTELKLNDMFPHWYFDFVLTIKGRLWFEEHCMPKALHGNGPGFLEVGRS